MRKVIHQNFELDLTPFKITDTTENAMFSDKFSAKYSFPIEIDVTEDIDKAFGFISFHNANEALIYINVKYVHNNEISDAILEVQEIGQKMTILLSWGFDEFPSWNKKLSDLDLQKITVADIYNHCLTVDNQLWPNVNYNFPQIHTDEFDIEETKWLYFKKIINHKNNIGYFQNTVDTNEYISYNRNIIQPLPYLLYLIKQGFLEENWEINGDIFENELLKKALVFSNKYNYFTPSEVDFNLLVNTDQVVNSNPQTNTTFEFSLNLSDKPGKYSILGIVSTKRSFGATWFKIFLNDVLVWEINYDAFPDYSIDFQEIELYVDLIDGPNVLKIESRQLPYDNNGLDFTQGLRAICDLIVNPVFLLIDGEYAPTVYNPNEVDLKKAVPDLTYGEFFTIVKNWFNLNITYDLNTKTASVNFIQNAINNSQTKDLSTKEIKYPTRKYNKGNSFLLKFKDINSDVYNFLPVFHSYENIVNENFTITEKTSTIEVNGLPLPLMDRNGSNTAHAFESDSSKVYLVLYDGLSDGLNLSKSNHELLIPQIHETYWKKWFNRRLNAVNYLWTYIADSIDLLNFSVYDKIHAYKNIHLIKSIQKTELKPDLFEVEIETEAEQ